jgi:adenine specific DNA methylase Mod
MNRLYYGDNLEVLRERIADQSVDLVYLDPPFNSNRSYNVIFARHAGDASGAAAQIQAFDDTWHWTPVTDQQYQQYVAGELPMQVADALTAFRTLLGENDAMAYLVNMAPRLVELRRVLKPTGSLYLHCDPTMSHYLKLLLDAIFGAERFLNEIAWQRAGAKDL